MSYTDSLASNILSATPEGCLKSLSDSITAAIAAEQSPSPPLTPTEQLLVVALPPHSPSEAA